MKVEDNKAAGGFIIFFFILILKIIQTGIILASKSKGWGGQEVSLSVSIRYYTHLPDHNKLTKCFSCDRRG